MEKIRCHVFEYFLAFSFVLLYLSFFQSYHKYNSDEHFEASIQRSTIFGKIYQFNRKLIIYLIKLKRTLLFQNKNVIIINNNEINLQNKQHNLSETNHSSQSKAPTPDSKIHTMQTPTPPPNDPTLSPTPTLEVPKITSTSSPSLTHTNTPSHIITHSKTQQNHITSHFSSSTISVSHTPEPNSYTPQPEPTIVAQPTVTDDAEPIIRKDVEMHLSSISSKLSSHVTETFEIISNIRNNVDNLFTLHESEVEFYLSQIDDEEGSHTHKPTLSLLPSKFFDQFEGVSLPKGDNNLWEAAGTSAEFKFKVLRKSVFSKISFGYVSDETCVMRKFYVKMRLKEEEIASNIFTLKTMSAVRQNFTLAFPVQFDDFDIVAVDNYGNQSYICLPDFKVYQRVGFLSANND